MDSTATKMSRCFVKTIYYYLSDRNDTGIELCDVECKIFQLADDTTRFMKIGNYYNVQYTIVKAFWNVQP